MEVIKDYTPEFYEFKYPETNLVPEILFPSAKTIEEARSLVSGHLVAINEAVTAVRSMDSNELSKIREQYQDELENNLPDLERKSFTAEVESRHAKERATNAAAEVSGCLIRIKDLSSEAHKGTTEQNFSALDTWKVPFGEKYAVYAWVDEKCTLVAIEDIPFNRKGNLLESGNNNITVLSEMAKSVSDEMEMVS